MNGNNTMRKVEGGGINKWPRKTMTYKKLARQKQWTKKCDVDTALNE